MLLTVIITILILLAGLLYYLVYIKPRLDPEYRAEAMMKQNLLREAAVEYRKALENKPDDFVARYRLANIYLKLNEVDDALVQLEQVLRIDRYNSEVDKHDVQKKLAEIYLLRDDIEMAFQTYLDVLNVHPTDYDALYHVSFILLGQEEFDMAQRYFERLAKISKDDFEVFFGAGICSYQNQRYTDAAGYFKEALSVKPHSDAANLAMAFALEKKKDPNQAVSYASAVADGASDPMIRFVSKRFLAFLYAHAKKHDEALKLFEEVLDIGRANEMAGEELLALLDLGFACIRADKANRAYDYWNQLYEKDRNYENIQRLVTLLRREMDRDSRKPRDDFEDSIVDHVEGWLGSAFPQNFIWEICGLKSDRNVDVRNVMVSARISVPRDAEGEGRKAGLDSFDRLEKFNTLDNEGFRMAANRVVSKMGYKVDQILQTYRENDGVDFLAYSMADKERCLVWVRRWTKMMVGEITLRNFAQAINDQKAKQGLFISTTDLTEAAKGNLDKLSKITVIYPDQLNEFLRGVI